MKKTFLFILVFVFNYSNAQNNYNKLTTELIKIIESNHFGNQFDTDKILTKINELPDSLQLDLFQKTAYKLFFEIAYGHKPKYFEYVSLKDSIDFEKINNAVRQLEIGNSYEKLVLELEPKSTIFQKLKPFSANDSLPQLAENLNFQRYLNRFKMKKYIIVNIPSAFLQLYDDDKLVLDMPIIVGRKANQTPKLASYFESITVYPYWVPSQSIVTKELLPAIKKDIKYIDRNGFDVLDKEGNLVNPFAINWQKLSADYFPYKLRQSTGCDNSLGLLKFNLKNPFSVYLHDTKHQKSSQDLFLKQERFFSHGCMRLSKPKELANLLLEKPIFDDAFMETCLKAQAMKIVTLPNKIPVFIIYETQQIDSKGVFHQYKNPYNIKI